MFKLFWLSRLSVNCSCGLNANLCIIFLSASFRDLQERASGRTTEVDMDIDL